MGALRKMGVYLGLVEDEQFDEYDDEYDDVRRDVRRRSDGRDRYADADDDVDDRYRQRPVRTIPESRAVRTFRSDSGQERRPTSAPMAERRQAPVDISRIEMVHPRSYNDARRIGEDYRDGVPVIMNVSDLDDSDAKRIIDFAAGLVFGLRGSIEKVTNKVFLLSPPNVELGAQARAQLEQDGFFNQS